MLRNTKTKLLLVIFLIITFLGTLSYAADENTAPATNEATTTQTEVVPNEPEEGMSAGNAEDSGTSQNKDIHEGDLYLTGDKVTMDKLVNGNVYIMGNDVTITGQIAGNLFLLANKANFEDAYIESSVYLCANEVKFKAVASDLYVCSNTLEIPTDYGVYRDLKSYSNSLTILGIIGRNVDSKATTISLNKDDSKASIYGIFNYASPTEIEVPEGAVQGETKYTQIVNTNKSLGVKDYLFGASCAVIFTLVIYGIAILFTKNSIEKCTEITSKKSLPAFGIGILSIILVPIASILLLISGVCVPVAFALLVLFGLLLSISTSVFAISIANIVSQKLKVSNAWLKALFVLVASLLVYVIGIIPYIFVIKCLFVVLGLGTIIMNMFFKNLNFDKKEKTSKEKKVKETKTKNK